MSEPELSNKTEVTSGEQKSSPRRSLPMHIRMLGLYQVKYIFGVIGHVFSMLFITLIVGLFSLRSVDVPIEKIEQRVREASISALGFVFPDYIAEVNSVGIDLDPAYKGWVKVSEITLLDIVQNRYISIDEFRVSPSIRGLLTGDFKFDFVGASRTEIQFQAAETENRSRFGYPINLLDIPANILSDNGQVEIDDMTMIVTSPKGTELVAVQKLSATLLKTNGGYDGRITARHADKEAGAFSFRVQREDDKVSWQGNAREYKVTPDKKLGVDFDLDLVFDDVPQYDLTEQTDNVRYPYRYLTKADGLVRAKFADWIGGGQFEFDPDTKVLKLAEMELSDEDYSFNGEVDVTIGDEMLISGNQIKLSYPTNLDQTSIDELSFVGKLDLIRRQFELGEIYVVNGPFELSGKGAVGFQDDLNAQFTLQSAELSREDIIDYWPKGIAEKTFDWASANIDEGQFKNVRLDALFKDKFAFELSMTGSDVVMKPTKWFPRVHSDFVRLGFTNEHLLITSPKAETLGQGTSGVKFSDIMFWVPSMKVKPFPAELDLNFSSPAAPLLASLSSDPVNLPARMKMAANRFSGQANGKLSVDFPMKKGGVLSDTDLDVRANISNFGLSKLFNNKNLSAKSVDLVVTENSVKVDGNVQIDRLSGNASLSQSFARGSKPDIKVAGKATRAQLSSIGVKLPAMITGDGIGYDLKVVPTSGSVEVIGEADIRSLGISVGGLGSPKSIGRAGTATFNVKASGKNVNIENLKISSGQFSTGGDIVIKNGKMASLNFPKVNWPGRYSGGLKIDGNSRISLKNGVVDLGGVSSGGSGGGASNQEVSFDNTTIKLTNKITLANASGRVKLGSIISGDLDGRLGGTSPVHVNLRPSKGQTLATVTSNDAGSVLKNAGLFGDLRGGRLELKVRTTERSDLYAGKFHVTGARLSNSRTMGQLLQAASIFGALNDRGLKIDEAGGDLLITSDRIDLYSGHAYGPEIGITLGGSYGITSSTANLAGVITPAYLLNGAFQKIPGFGELIGGNVGEGVFGVTYLINGRSPNYTIQANPLSLLTPGKFREIWSNVPQARAIPQQYRVD